MGIGSSSVIFYSLCVVFSWLQSAVYLRKLAPSCINDSPVHALFTY